MKLKVVSLRQRSIRAQH